MNQVKLMDYGRIIDVTNEAAKELIKNGYGYGDRIVFHHIIEEDLFELWITGSTNIVVDNIDFLLVESGKKFNIELGSKTLFKPGENNLSLFLPIDGKIGESIQVKTNFYEAKCLDPENELLWLWMSFDGDLFYCIANDTDLPDNYEVITGYNLNWEIPKVGESFRFQNSYKMGSGNYLSSDETFYTVTRVLQLENNLYKVEERVGNTVKIAYVIFIEITEEDIQAIILNRKFFNKKDIVEEFNLKDYYRRTLFELTLVKFISHEILIADGDNFFLGERAYGFIKEIELINSFNKEDLIKAGYNIKTISKIKKLADKILKP